MTSAAVAAVEAQPDLKPNESCRSSAVGCLVIVARHHGMHLTGPQVIRDNFLADEELSTSELVRCAKRAGLATKVVKLDWPGLGHLHRLLPAIVRLKNGNCLILRRLELDDDHPHVVLDDANAGEAGILVVDRFRFADAWSGEVILLKRNYDIADETQPFSLGMIAGLIFRERRIVRDVAISAILMGFLALSPIVFFRLLIDRVLAYKFLQTFYVLCILMLILIAFETAFSYVRRFLILHLTARVDVKLATYMFDRVLNLPIDFFERTQVGFILRDMNEMWRIRTFLIGQFFGTILDSVMLLFFIPVMFFFSATVTAVVLALGVLVALWLIVMLPYYKKRLRAAIYAEAERGAFLVQTLFGIRTVKSLALDSRQRHFWDVHAAKVAKLRFAEGQAGNLIESVALPLERLMVSGSIALLVYLAVSSNSPTYYGAIFAFMLMSNRVAAPLRQASRLVNELDEARSAVGLVAGLVNRPPEEGRSGHGVRTPLRGHVAFSDLTFKYAGATSPALEDVSFEISAGTTLGIMGRSGSGKTTITRLLQRLHSDYEGLIKIDGIDVREYDVDHLRGSLGVVLQENFLFRGTIRDNIMIAKSDAGYDAVVRAARLAGAEEFIEKLPRGYETFVYEGSPNLSGGQRQRLAIARALITDPRILILDEATSALDADSEAIVNANLHRIARGRTMIIISHRLSSLVEADAIMVLERGRVMDIGKHEELLERSEIYSGLWQTQNRHVVAPSSRRDKQPGGPHLVS
jgi:ATP-binding cassette, subfamily B, bacterial HlyB/CyaB